MPKVFAGLEKWFTFAPSFRQAQMAESVDALVSNTSGFISMPVRPRLWVLFKNANPRKSICLRGLFLFAEPNTEPFSPVLGRFKHIYFRMKKPHQIIAGQNREMF